MLARRPVPHKEVHSHLPYICMLSGLSVCSWKSGTNMVEQPCEFVYSLEENHGSWALIVPVE